MLTKPIEYTWNHVRQWAVLNTSPEVKEIALLAEKGNYLAWRELEERFLNENARTPMVRVDA